MVALAPEEVNLSVSRYVHFSCQPRRRQQCRQTKRDERNNQKSGRSKATGLVNETASCIVSINGPITIAIRVRFEHDSATTRYEMRTIRLRFERDTTSYEELCALEQ